jgi:hypothetical protein
MTDDTNITPEPGDANPRFPSYLQPVPAGEQLADPVTVDAPPADSMRGQDVEAMFLCGSELASEPVPEPIVALTEEPELSEQQPASAIAPETEQAPTFQDLDIPSGADDFELPYSDGSTTPVDPPRRSLVRRRSRSQEEPVDQARLAQALEDTTADVWAAYRSDASNPQDGANHWNQPTACAPSPGRLSTRSVGLVALVLTLVVGIAGGAVAVLRVHDSIIEGLTV